MREHFGLDALVQYGTEEIPATVTVLNPAWRDRNRQVRQQQKEYKSLQKLQQNMGITQPLSEAVVAHYQQHQDDFCNLAPVLACDAGLSCGRYPIIDPAIRSSGASSSLPLFL